MVYSDEAKVYMRLKKMGYGHKSVKHKSEYVTNRGVHTNNIENLWTNIKSANKKMTGCNRRHMSLHIDEFVY